MNKLYHWLFFLFFILGIGVNAQNFTITSGDMPSSVVACGDESTFRVNVFGPLPSGSKITLALPAQVGFASLVSGDVTVDATNPSNVVMTTTSALAGAGDRMVIEYTVKTSCEALPASPKISYATGSVTKEIDYPTVEYSLLEVTGVTQTATSVPVYGTSDFTINVRQSGNAYSNNVKVLITHTDKVQLSTAAGTLTAGTPSGGNQTDVLELTAAQIAAIGDGDNRFENGESITATVKAKLIACGTGSQTLDFQAAYGCGTFSHCTTGNVTSKGFAEEDAGTPSLTMKQTKEPRPGLSSGQQIMRLMSSKT